MALPSVNRQKRAAPHGKCDNEGGVGRHGSPMGNCMWKGYSSGHLENQLMLISKMRRSLRSGSWGQRRLLSRIMLWRGHPS
ncbi:hypothetical protein M404DRAFT_239267 [Pisolithus tinctorius Marx 270]|uniref:Uncharacterized protein n=1 Tax=Pisolithus tinctorius Marx 270 TaxID=870435 RepID=A0A0C3NMK6_PISTI|nr:hypothetical protein M404DRAFT_239267 [Pisolithus tinctorius Marx 270]